MNTTLSLLRATTIVACIATLCGHVAVELSLLKIPSRLLRTHPAVVVVLLIAIWRVRPNGERVSSVRNARSAKRYDGTDGVLILGAFLIFVGIPLYDWYSAERPFRSPDRTAFLFSAALGRGDYQQAFDLCSPAFQEQVRNPAGLQRLMEDGGGPSENFWHTEPTVNGDRGAFEVLRRNDASGLWFKEQATLERSYTGWSVASLSSIRYDMPADSPLAKRSTRDTAANDHRAQSLNPGTTNERDN